VVGEVGQEVRDGLLCAGHVLGFEIRTVGGEDELGPGGDGFGAGFELIESLPGLALRTGNKVDIVDEQYRARDVGLVVVPLAQTLEGGLLLIEGGKELIGKFCSLVGRGREVRNGGLNLNGVHRRYLAEVSQIRNGW
jgi:hypothetical protein